MIEDIQIRDLGVIQEAELVFDKGLTVLTGETGAGKTMVLTALGLLLGERSDSNAVRSGTNQTSIAGTWHLPPTHPVLAKAEEAGALIDDGTLLLSRMVGADGRSKAVAGGRAIPVGLLAELGGDLVVVHGQADQIRLKSPAAQRNALDKYAGKEHLALVQQYKVAYNSWRDALTKLQDATSGTEAIAKEKLELTEALEFLGKLDPKLNEDIELQELAQRLTHTEALRHAVALAHDALIAENFDAIDAIGQIGVARKAIESASNYDASLEPIAETLSLLSQQLNDAAAELSGYLSSIDGDRGMNLDEIQERRSQISLAMRRFGPTLQDVLDFQVNAQQRLLFLDGGSQSVSELEALVQSSEKNARELAELLSTNRKAAASELSAGVTAELKSLAMAGSSLHVVVEAEKEIGAFGADSVSFLLESYEGAEPRPIAKAASGGELSRIMLALEVILSETENAATFIFDEVDAGVGGAAAIEVGKRLASLAKRAQVIVVTHLAQVAAFANKHLVVVKSNAAGFTASDVQDIQGEDRATELARMLSGLQESGSAREHAQELLDLAKQL